MHAASRAAASGLNPAWPSSAPSAPGPAGLEPVPAPDPFTTGTCWAVNNSFASEEKTNLSFAWGSAGMQSRRVVLPAPRAAVW